MSHEKFISRQRLRRRRHVRRQVRGSTDRPRLSVFRSLTHMHCQVIDDSTGKTLVSASTQEKDIRGQVSYGGNKNAAGVIGKAIAERAQAAGIKKVCFDRGHYQYHGRVAALTDAAREAGLQF